MLHYSLSLMNKTKPSQFSVSLFWFGSTFTGIFIHFLNKLIFYFQVFELYVWTVLAIMYIDCSVAKPMESYSIPKLIKRPSNSGLATSRVYLQNLHNNRTAHDPADRYPRPGDWQCRTEDRWINMGESYYPRFIKQVVCTSRFCYNDFYTCFPQYYPLTVLRKLRINELPSRNETTLSALPPPLRDTYSFEVVEVSVGCLCGE